MNQYSYDQLNLGQLEHFSVTITPKMMDLFCEISGDVNPLHRDDHFAQSSGFDHRVVYGLLTASFFSTLAGVYLPGVNALIHRVDVRFIQPVYIGDTLNVSGEVTDRIDAFKTITVRATITNQSHEIVSKATLQIGVLK